MKQIFLLALYVFGCNSEEQNNFNRITSVLLGTTDDPKTNITKWETAVNFDCVNVDLSKFDVNFFHKFDGNGPIAFGKIWASPKQEPSNTPIKLQEPYNTLSKFRNDYVYKPGFGFYKFHNTFVNWLMARKICDEEGTHLAIINSDAERDLLMNLWREQTDPKLKSIDSIALGFHDLDTENKFVTVQGDPIESTGFAKWCRGQPDNYQGDEHCGSLNVIQALLNDIPCSKNVVFICEKGDK